MKRLIVCLVMFVPGVLLAQDDRWSSQRATVGRELVDFLGSIASELEAKGPNAWLDVFWNDPQFFMASDGVVAFADYDSARRFLADFSQSVTAIRLEWIEPKVQVLGPEMGLVASAYREAIERTEGEPLEFGGYFSGLAVRTPEGWKLRHLHWSRPVAAELSEIREPNPDR